MVQESGLHLLPLFPFGSISLTFQLLDLGKGVLPVGDSKITTTPSLFGIYFQNLRMLS